jgi:hypothetical protein
MKFNQLILNYYNHSMNFEDEFNNNIRDIYWQNQKSKIEIINNFDSACRQYKAASACENQLKSWRKNQMGYRGVGKSRGLISGLSSKEALNLQMKDCVWDHVIGVTLIGKTIEKLIESNNLDIDLIVEKYLYSHLYLWGKVKVTKEEHRSQNIIRNKHSLDQKIRLEHYERVSPLCIDERMLRKLNT